MTGSPAPFPQPFLKLLVSSEASQEVAMEMGPQAEHDNDLGQGGAAVGASALLDTRPAHVLSPRKDVRTQLRRTEGPEQEQGFLPTRPAGSLPLSRAYRALFRSNCKDAAKVGAALGEGERTLPTNSMSWKLYSSSQKWRLRGVLSYRLETTELQGPATPSKSAHSQPRTPSPLPPT